MSSKDPPLGPDGGARASDAGHSLKVSVHRYLVSRGWEQRRFVDGDHLWHDPCAHGDSHPEQVAYPTWLALTVQWYRDSTHPHRRVRASSPNVGSGRISGV